MLYRKTPATPPRLLLRIMATAGTGALLGAAACGGVDSTSTGSPVSPVRDVADAQPTGDDGSITMGFVVGMPTGLLPLVRDAGGDATLACGTGFCGSAVMPPADGGDAGADASGADTSDAAAKDAADDAGLLADDGGSLHCPPVCGVVVHP
jgi:hypothetical protein